MTQPTKAIIGIGSALVASWVANKAREAVAPQVPAWVVPVVGVVVFGVTRRVLTAAITEAIDSAARPALEISA